VTGSAARRAAATGGAAPAQDRGRVPFRVRPMLATLVAAPFHLPGWIHEEKYDGYRVVAYKEGRAVSLITRNLKDRTAQFPEIAAAIARLPAPTLALDGEVVVFDRAGISRFQFLQRGDVDGASGPPVFVAFDCLFARGHDLRDRPLVERRRVLEREVPEAGAARRSTLRLARRLATNGLEAFDEARRLGLEGLVAKEPESRYVAGVRSPAWRKVKVRNEEEFVIGGFTAPEGVRRHLGALLVGAWDDGRLRYAGKVGTGFTERTLTDLASRLRPLVRRTPPFVDPERERGVTWVEPELVAQIAFTEMTSDGRLRHPSFLGLREDKPARDVRWPRPA
jgi:bifunctional non-homologous end joining protein LigD